MRFEHVVKDFFLKQLLGHHKQARLLVVRVRVQKLDPCLAVSDKVGLVGVDHVRRLLIDRVEAAKQGVVNVAHVARALCPHVRLLFRQLSDIFHYLFRVHTFFVAYAGVGTSFSGSSFQGTASDMFINVTHSRAQLRIVSSPYPPGLMADSYWDRLALCTD